MLATTTAATIEPLAAVGEEAVEQSHNRQPGQHLQDDGIALDPEQREPE